jgi:hypothetical protein
MNERIRAMNERIKEILAQPELERLNDWASIGPVQRAALEEFADLIVKECAELAEGCYCGDTVKSLLLNHFGIEP